jgi:hypothetical protein
MQNLILELNKKQMRGIGSAPMSGIRVGSIGGRQSAPRPPAPVPVNTRKQWRNVASMAINHTSLVCNSRVHITVPNETYKFPRLSFLVMKRLKRGPAGRGGRSPMTCLMRHKSVSKSFRTGHLARELQMVKLSATRCSYIAVLWVSLVSFVAITFCVASQRVFIVVSIYFVIDSVRKLLDTPSYFFFSRPQWFKSWSSGLCHHVMMYDTNFLENRVAPVFRKRRQGSPKRWYPTAPLHGVITQKNATWT